MLDEDSLHCGACGHDCLGGACEGGECQPVSLFSSSEVDDFEVDDEYVFVATRTGLERVEQSRDATVLSLNSHPVGSSTIATRRVELSGGYVFESGGTNLESSFIYRLQKAGGTPLPVLFSSAADLSVAYPRGLIASETRVVWFVRNTHLEGTSYAIRGVGVDGLDEEVYQGFSGDAAMYIALDHSFVYWYDNAESSIVRESSGGAAVDETIFVGVSDLRSIAAAEGKVFFVGTVDGTHGIYAIESDGVGLRSLVTDASGFLDDHASGFAVAEGELLWLSRGAATDRAIFGVSVDGMSNRVVYEGNGTLERPRTNAAADFWYEDDRVWMRVK